MLRIVDEGLLPSCRGAPQNEDHRAVLLREHADRRVGEFLPADISVGIRLMRPDRQHRVEKKDALLRPFCEIPMVGNRAAQIRIQILINIDQRRGNADPLVHRKTQTVRLSRSVIRILTEDHGADIFQRREGERIENIPRRRINFPRSVLIQDRFIKLSVIRLCKFGL